MVRFALEGSFLEILTKKFFFIEKKLGRKFLVEKNFWLKKFWVKKKFGSKKMIHALLCQPPQASWAPQFWTLSAVFFVHPFVQFCLIVDTLYHIVHPYCTHEPPQFINELRGSRPEAKNINNFLSRLLVMIRQLLSTYCAVMVASWVAVTAII